MRPRLTRTLERLVARELEVAADLLGAGLLQAIAHLAHDLSTCAGYKDGANPLAIWAELPGSPQAIAADLPRWLSLVDLLLTKGDKAKWRTGLGRSHIGVEISTDQQQQLQYLIADAEHRTARFRELPGALCKLRLLRRRCPTRKNSGTMSRLSAGCFVRLSLSSRSCSRSGASATSPRFPLTARQLLRSEAAAPDLLSASIGGLRHLLVDEMQDTSAGQYELLERLTEAWDGATQTVFLVGDPKQSIYEFRQARVERFLRVMQEGRLGQLPLGAVYLTANFRSQAALVGDFNTTFGTILPRPEQLAADSESGEVPFVAAVATRRIGVSPAIPLAR